MNRTFSPGDEVYIRDYDYLFAHRNESPTINGTMLSYACRKTTIRRSWGGTVSLDIDDGNYVWLTDWLEDAEPTEVDVTAFDDMF